MHPGLSARGPAGRLLRCRTRPGSCSRGPPPACHARERARFPARSPRQTANYARSPVAIHRQWVTCQRVENHQSGPIRAASYRAHGLCSLCHVLPKPVSPMREARSRPLRSKDAEGRARCRPCKILRPTGPNTARKPCPLENRRCKLEPGARAVPGYVDGAGRGLGTHAHETVSQIAGEGGTSDLVVDDRKLVPFRCEPQNRGRKAGTAGPE